MKFKMSIVNSITQSWVKTFDKVANEIVILSLIVLNVFWEMLYLILELYCCIYKDPIHRQHKEEIKVSKHLSLKLLINPLVLYLNSTVDCIVNNIESQLSDKLEKTAKSKA